MVKSFAYLKKPGTYAEKAARLKEAEKTEKNSEKKPDETFLPVKKNNDSKFLSKITVQPFDNDSEYFSPVKKELKEFSRTDSLLVSGFCYGCINFFVDAPGTKLEMGWCKRIDGNSKIIYKRIRATTLIRQCPGKIEN